MAPRGRFNTVTLREIVCQSYSVYIWLYAEATMSSS